MITKTFDVALDMKRSSSREFEVVEGDSGNIVRVALTDDGEPVELTDRLVVAVFALPDGTTVEQDTTEGSVTIEGNVATIALKTGSVKPGTVNCELQVYGGEDNATLVTSAQFNFRCRRSIMNADTIQATDQYPLLTKMLVEVAALDALVTDAEAERAVAESAREQNEQARQAAELQREEKTDEVYEAYTSGALKGEKGDQGEPGSYETHAHGNVTNAGAIGTAAGRVVCTGEGGVLEAADAEEAAALLGVDGKAPLVHAARHASGGADAVTPAAIGAVAASEKGAAGGVATLNGSGTITGVQSCSPVVDVSDGDTIGIQQIGQTLRASPTSGETFTLTIQAGVFSVNDEFTVLLSGPGTVIVQGQENVQIRGANFSGAVEISTRYASVSFKKFVENANGEYFSVAGPGIGMATLDENGRLQAEQACSNVVEHYNITNYTMSTNDVGKAHLFTMPSGSQATMTITLPASLPVGTEFEMLKGNSGTTLVVSAGTGATISTINKSGQSSVRAGSGKFALITLKRYDQNWWFATGADE